ncbi:MAG TPA: hypothetical protein DER60_13475 [Syntrophomonas sp.]|nr:hypothetical protein [Syntrophomonas sp.]
MVMGKKELLRVLVVGILTVVLLLGTISTMRHLQQPVAVNQVAGDFTPVEGIQAETTTNVVSGGFFNEYRLNRDRLRSKQVEMLQDVIKNSGSDAKTRDAAGMRLVDITAAMEKELKAENLIKAEGYQECVIMVQADSTTIVLQSPTMQPQQVKRVKELVGQAVNSSPDKLSLVTRGQP